MELDQQRKRQNYERAKRVKVEDDEEDLFIKPLPKQSSTQVDAEQALSEMLKSAVKYVPNESLGPKGIKIDEFSSIPILSDKELKQRETIV